MKNRYGDMDPDEFRKAAHQVADQIADYLKELESYSVLPDIAPGDVKASIPKDPPASPQPWDDILQDYRTLVQPNITHWQHPGFMAYFPSVASGPGILGEWLAAGLNSNVMFWRNAPASTEVEERTVEWLRSMLGLPALFDGMLTDTASISSLLSITVARHAVPGLDARQSGLAAGKLPGRLRLYQSTEAHMTIDKAAIVTGVGLDGIRRIPADAEYRMRPELLEAAIAEDRENGWIPFCVVGTLGTTSSTSVDPADRLADICEREKLWLHLDAAYAGTAALAEEFRHHFKGWERANSIVVNPHKWMFTPFDASLLLFRDRDQFRDTFSLVPEYIKTPDTGEVHNFNEYGVQLGRRFRALKLWMMIRYFGSDGMAARVRHHVEMAREMRSWIEAEPDWEMLAPTPFATLCFRYAPKDVDDLDSLNEAIMAKVNKSGDIFLSHTKLNDRYTIRVSIGNPRQTMDHVRRCWELLKEAAVS
ncbi:MAG: amino acid decarboxylase [Acidobacteria bacterium]|uniref:Amino acid decarboxylase n=1 Tax=Candidatus Polarisedimenticola svalbardensis TaxID=2886004 RepID=A0A8J6XU48_9BACT|nr:amino acid decarboxylase [Candidatus Polarisedimenticola svalbardensis]